MQDEENKQTGPGPSIPSDSTQDDKGESKDDQDVGRSGRCVKCDEYLAGWKRAQADYANLKKEFDKTKSEIAMYANENLLYELLPAIDQFEIALQHLPEIQDLPDEQKKKMQNWLTGINAVKQMWEQTFKSIGLDNVETAGEFDPSKHEAIGEEEDADKPHDAILRVTQPGWNLNGKVLRPAKVVVNKL